MKKSKFTEEQMVRILKEVEAGAKVAETCRKHGISEPTYYVWKSKYAGMEVSQLRHLKDVEVELARMKRMYAELALDHHVLKGFYPEITDGCERVENFESRLAIRRRIRRLWNRSMYSNTSAFAASSVG